MKKTLIVSVLVVMLGGAAAFALVREGACGNACPDRAGSACSSKAHKAAVTKASLQEEAHNSCPDRPGCVCSH